MLRGFLYATIAACTFGLIPLFVAPLLAEGIPATSNLFYRFGFSALFLMLVGMVTRQPLAICKKDFAKFLCIGFFYALCAITFLWAFEYMDIGIVVTVQYCYPIFVVLLMVTFFGERFRISTFMAALFICIGVALFSIQDTSQVKVTFMGMALSIFSATQLAIYIMGIQVFNFKVNNQLIMSMYIMLGGAIFVGLFSMYEGGIVLPTTGMQWLNIALLTLVTGVTSTLTLVRAVHYIGPSLTSILGGFEPITGMLVGIFVFGEACTALNIAGAVCIVGAVTFVAVLTHFRRDI